jgi:hypothetical protein
MIRVLLDVVVSSHRPQSSGVEHGKEETFAEIVQVLADSQDVIPRTFGRRIQTVAQT